MTGSSPARYHAVAIFLHWTIALLIVGVLVIGFIMDEAPPELKFKLFQLHKSCGLLALALSLVRLVWRATHRAPPLPPDTKRWEKGLTHAVQFGFYVLMIGLPLAGWLGVSASPRKMPLTFFGLFDVPLLPFFNGAADPQEITHDLFELHEALAWGVIALLVLHVGAALKHHFMLRDDVMLHMAPKCLDRTLRTLRGRDA